MKHYQERSFIEKYPLSWKKPIKKTLYHSIYFLFIIIFLLIFLIMKGPSNLAHENGLIIVSLVIIIGLISILSIYTYQYWYYKTYFYNITDEYLIIHKGIIAPQEVTLPLKRIQDVYVDQDILDQLFGLYDVHFSSATATSGQKAHIDGLEKEVAEKLREFILHKIK